MPSRGRAARSAWYRRTRWRKLSESTTIIGLSSGSLKKEATAPDRAMPATVKLAPAAVLIPERGGLVHAAEFAALDNRLSHRKIGEDQDEPGEDESHSREAVGFWGGPEYESESQGDREP